MKRIALGNEFLWTTLTAALVFSAATATAVDFTIDPSNPNNGLFDIYSATFDPPLNPGGDPFFGGTPPATREITINPAPTGALAAADTSLCVQDFDPAVPAPPIVPPCTTLYPTATPSSLDLTLSAGNTQLAINGGNVFFPHLVINISGSTDVLAEGASIVNFAASPGTVPIDGNGVAVLEIDIAPATAADFATFTEIVTSCTGPLCALIPILTLDMNRYRLTIDWDPTFSFFTADFIGQTANNSMVFTTLDSGIPKITVTNAVEFGNIIKNSTGEQTVVVTNDGLTDLVIGQIAQATPLSAPFSIPALTDNCSAQRVAPDADCAFIVQYSPTTDNSPADTDSFDIPSNDPNMATVTVSVRGTGVAPVIIVTNLVEFGDVTVNPPTPPEKTVTISNGGNEPLELISIAQDNPLAPPFSIDTADCLNKTPLSPIGGPNNSCTLTVQFNPDTAGLEQLDSFDIQSNDPDTLTATVDVSGTGTTDLVSKINVIDTVDFGSVTETTAADRTVTITSSGTQDLEIFSIAAADPLSAPFSILTDNCSMRILPPNDSCMLTVRFAPTGTGLEQDSFDIASSDLDTPTTTVNVRGTGVPAQFPEINVTDSVSFGDVIETMSADETVTVTNSGTADLILEQITVADPQGPFSVEDDFCSMQALPPEALCMFTIRFAPPATGMFIGTVDIPSNDPNFAIVTVTIDGTGTPTAPDISVSDEVEPDDDLMMPFGNVTEATAWDRKVKITNVGNGNLEMGMIAQTDSLVDSFSILNDNCSNQIIAPAAGCTFDVRFLPVRVDNFSDSFDIPSNDPDEPSLTFRVTGSGVAVGTGTISLQPDGADSGLFGSAIRPATLLALLGLVAANLRRRRYH